MEPPPLRILEEALHSFTRGEDATIFASLFVVENGFAILLEALVRWVDQQVEQRTRRSKRGCGNCRRMAVGSNRCCASYRDWCHPQRKKNDNLYHKNKLRSALQRAMPRAMPAVSRLLDYYSQQQAPPPSDSDDDENGSPNNNNNVLLLLLEIVHASIGRCEANKVLWMKTTITITQEDDQRKKRRLTPFRSPNFFWIVSCQNTVTTTATIARNGGWWVFGCVAY